MPNLGTSSEYIGLWIHRVFKHMAWACGMPKLGMRFWIHGFAQHGQQHGQQHVENRPPALSTYIYIYLFFVCLFLFWYVFGLRFGNVRTLWLNFGLRLGYVDTIWLIFGELKGMWCQHGIIVRWYGPSGWLSLRSPSLPSLSPL